MIWLYELYYKFFLSQGYINKLIKKGIIVHDVYFIISALFNNEPISSDMVGMPWIYFGIWLLVLKYFQKWIGKFWILQFQCWQTKEFQKNVMDKNIKAAGKRGGYKDTSQSGIASNFCKCCIESITELVKENSVYLYMFDLEQVKNDIIKIGGRW